jgi:hypothetical protein
VVVVVDAILSTVGRHFPIALSLSTAHSTMSTQHTKHTTH